MYVSPRSSDRDRLASPSYSGLGLLLGLLLGAGGDVRAQQTVGLFVNDDASYEGYTLFTPLISLETYLIDHDGKEVNRWTSAYRPGVVVYLLDNGHLLRTAQFAPAGSPFNAGGAGGRVEEFDWDGTLVWEFEYATADHRLHHDLEKLPNGNVLMIAWELRDANAAIAAGRDPSLLLQGELWPEHVIEVEPGGISGGTIVWEWHVWDHLIQDFDPTKLNFGVVGDHPELIDINGGSSQADWMHSNAIDYNAELDQIMISSPRYNELWVLDHSTTSAEAAGHSGGNSGRGGDLLYRWGNPQNYDRGTPSSQRLFGQHDTQWIEPGLPGAGNILVFNNGVGRPEGNYSSVDELAPPVDGDGNYLLLAGAAYGPTSLVWTYEADPPSSFAASFVSGAQRQPNGNTLVCAGPFGRVFEVLSMPTTTVWEYVIPVNGAGQITQGFPATGNANFRSYRYSPDFSGFDGVDLTPGEPIELFTAPLPVPDGRFFVTNPLTASRLNAGGDQIRVLWDPSSCTSDDYHLIFGRLDDVSTYEITGSRCDLGTAGVYDWPDVPPENLFFLVVGTDPTGTYESSWGIASDGDERNGATPSHECGVTSKVTSATCP